MCVKPGRRGEGRGENGGREADRRVDAEIESRNGDDHGPGCDGKMLQKMSPEQHSFVRAKKRLKNDPFFAKFRGFFEVF